MLTGSTALAVENARLRICVAKMETDARIASDEIRLLTRERDEARAEADRYNRTCGALSAEVSRLEGMILDWVARYESDGFTGMGTLLTEGRRIRAQRGRGLFAPNVMFQTYKRLLGLEEPELKYKSEREAYAALRGGGE